MAKYQDRPEDRAARFGPPARRTFSPLATGFVLAGLAGWIFLRSDVLRHRFIAQAHAIGARVLATVSGSHDGHDIHRAPVAFTAAETMPIAAPTYADETMAGSTGYPPGLGSDPADVREASEVSVAD